jgi:hypothetical protein
VSEEVAGERANDDPGTDVLAIISETGVWIRGADTKTGFGLTGLTVLLAAEASQARTLQILWEATSAAPAAEWLLAASAVFLAVAYCLFVGVLLPRTQTRKPNRFSWPWLCQASDEELGAIDSGAVRREAWLQARTLATIASTKFRFLNWAIRSTAVSVLLYLVAMLVR